MIVSRLTLRWRLTLYYGLISALIVLLGAGLILVSLQASLRQGLDGSLRTAAQIAASQLGGDEGAPSLSEQRGDRVQSQLPGSTVVQVFNRAGQRTDQLGQPRAQAPLRAGLVTVGRERLYTLRLPDGSWIQTARSELESQATVIQATRQLLLGLPLLLMLGVLAGYLLADRALRPVDSVTRLAQSIADSGRSHLRVPAAPGHDELARLTTTVNAMLERLAGTIEREKAFALAAAHELRTPLSVLQASAELSLERPRDPAHYVRTLETVRGSGAQMQQAIESLLALARAHAAPVSQPLDLAEVALQAAAGQLAAAQLGGHHLDLALDPAPGRGDPVALELAISNLIRNALAYGAPQGTVRVRSGRVGGAAQVSVLDEGPGLPEAELARVVQPFQRGQQQATRGAGLGLALVAAIASQHGGTLTLGRGSTGGLLATLRLPAGQR